MGEINGEIEVAASVADVWEVYIDRARWSHWVDGFDSILSSERYPEVGGLMVWRSTPAGRGEVSERVTAHEPRRLHRIVYTDPGSSGEVETRFEMVPAAGSERRTKVNVTHSYALEGGGLTAPVVDRLFVRPQMQRSLDRTLRGLRRAVGEEPGEEDDGIQSVDR